MKNKILLSIVISLLTLFAFGCSKENVEQKVVKEYFSYLSENKWEKAYQLLSKPTKDKFSLKEFSDWGKLANSVRMPQNSQTIKESRITEFGENEDMVIFDEAKIITSEVSYVDKINVEENKQEKKDIVHTVVGLENGEWKVYLEKLEKAVYLKELAKKYQKEKNFSKAAALYEEALNEDKEDIWAKYHLAENYDQLNKTEDAIKLVQEVIQQNEMILSFTVVEELKENLVQQYTFLVKLLEKQGDQKAKIQEYQVRIEELKQK